MSPERWRVIAAIAEEAIELHEVDRRIFFEAQVRAYPELADELALISRGLDAPDAFAADLSSRLSRVLDSTLLRAGEVLGAYTLDRVVGWGGMSTVYLAHRSDDQFHKTVAVKMLPARLRSTGDERRFRNERQILARLEHPSIARLLDGGVSPAGSPYYVLEYVEGKTADNFSDSANLDAVLAVVLEVCEAVHYAHMRLIVHCDLKPANILVAPDRRVKLLDFGIARILGDSSNYPLLGYLGNPVTRNYAAPELLARQSVDTRADVYSIGILLYRLVTGVQPYRLLPAAPPSLAQALQQRHLQPLVRVGHLASASPLQCAEIASIIDRAIELDPDRRTASVAVLAEQLRALRTHTPISPPPPGIAAYHARKAMRRNPVATVLAIAAVVSVLAVMGILATALVITRAETRRALAAERRTAEEIQVSREVVEFLTEVFNSADPDEQVAGSETSARDLLARGITRINAVDKREVASRLRVTLGRIARKLDQFTAAERLLSAVAVDQVDAPLSRQALLELGLTRVERGDRAQGVADLEEVIRRCEQAGDERCVLAAMDGRGDLELDAGDFAVAAATFNEAYTRASSVSEASYRDVLYLAQVSYGLALAEHRQGHWQEGSMWFERSAELYRQISHRPTSAAARSFRDQAIVLFHRGDFETASRLYEEARKIFIAVYGPRHDQIAYLDFLAAQTYLELGQDARALHSAQNSLGIRRELLGEDHAHTGLSWGRLALVLSKLGRSREAIEAARTARNITRTTSSQAYGNVGVILARLYLRLGDQDQALAVARTVLETYETVFGSQHAMTLRGHVLLAEVWSARGEATQATASQTRAVEMAATTLRPDHPKRLLHTVTLGHYQMLAGNHEEARRTLQRALEFGETTRPYQPEIGARARKLLADLEPQ